jgi:hypothetical protein
MDEFFVPILAWPVSPEEGGGSFGWGTLVFMLVLLLSVGLSEVLWERWGVDARGILRRWAPRLLWFVLGWGLSRNWLPDPADGGGMALFCLLLLLGFGGLMCEPRRKPEPRSHRWPDDTGPGI